jgi:hypothetical protein
VTLKSILADSRDSDMDFHGGKETLRLVLCDIGFSCGKFHVVKELKKLILNMLHEILSQVKIDELIAEHGHQVYIYTHIIAISTLLNLFGPKLKDITIATLKKMGLEWKL